MNGINPVKLKKIKILVAVLDLPANKHIQFGLNWVDFWPIGQLITCHLGMNYYVNFLGHLGSIGFQLK